MSPRPRNRRALLRWLAPVVAAVVFAGAGALVSALTSAASADLPPRSAATLLTDVAGARLSGASGTVVVRSDLGLPALPDGIGAAGGSSAGMGSLLSGSHTLRVWYAAPDRVRVALPSDFGESDLIRNGRSVWLWSSGDKTARHWQLPKDTQAPPGRDGGDLRTPLTPAQAAEAALQAISGSTVVRAAGTTTVAGRSAYLLTLAPRSADTLVGSVRIAIDGETHVPTRVQVFARGHRAPSFAVGFTSFDPGTPPASVFRFDPPPGAEVTGPDGWHAYTPLSGHPSGADSAVGAGRADSAVGAVGAGRAASAPELVGSGWDAVLVLPPSEQVRRLTGGEGELGAALSSLQRVSGSWGSGRLLRGTLFSVLVTDNGRVAIGAVPPQRLYDALSHR